MSSQATARVRGIPFIPSIKAVNIRLGPTTNTGISFKAPIGTDSLPILAVEPDAQGQKLNNKQYQWFKLRFADGNEGWVRDDLLDVKGDLQPFGYPFAEDYVFAFALLRDVSPLDAETKPDPVPITLKPEDGTDPIPEPDEPPQLDPEPLAFPDALADTDRVRKVAFTITTLFEGSGYAAYNNFDRGIVSYGLIQFTLAAGSLERVLRLYIGSSESDNANGLEGYMQRIAARDPGLRHDMNFRQLLLSAAAEPEMQAAQDQVATASYWDAVVRGYITPRDLKLPLTWALLFDMGVNFGVNHGFVRLAEKQLGVPPRSKPGENGISETQLIERVAQLRKQSHDRQAERDNLPGLRVRGDFWVGLVNAGDWYLRGSDGRLLVKGRPIDLMM